MSAPDPIYLDYNATAPLLAQARAAMDEVLDAGLVNPSSVHSAGRAARDRVEAARLEVARRLGANPSGVTFTSGATEAANLVIRGVARGRMVATAVEHPAVLEPCRAWATELALVGVSSGGRLDPDRVAAAVRSDTTLVAVMRVNNEIGSTFDTRAVAERIRHINAHAAIVVDAAQAIGRVESTLEATGADFLVVSAHKMGGPKGCGALVARRGAPSISAQLLGGLQERGLRAGTENVLGIVGFGAACAVEPDTAALAARTDTLRDALLAIPGARLHGDPGCAAPGTVSLRFDEVEGEALLVTLDTMGVCASSGSACASGTRDPSRVLLALGLTPAQAHGSIRLSLGHATSDSDVRQASERVSAAVQSLRTAAQI